MSFNQKIKITALSLIQKGLNEDKKLILKTSGQIMLPLISEGNKVIIKKADSFEIADIIAYYQKNNDYIEIIAHRIIAIREDGYVRTKGDNMDNPDPGWISPEKILGKVIEIISD